MQSPILSKIASAGSSGSSSVTKGRAASRPGPGVLVRHHRLPNWLGRPGATRRVPDPLRSLLTMPLAVARPESVCHNVCRSVPADGVERGRWLPVPEYETRGPHGPPRLFSPLLYHLSYLAEEAGQQLTRPAAQLGSPTGKPPRILKLPSCVS
jgi:hypothetical protein